MPPTWMAAKTTNKTWFTVWATSWITLCLTIYFYYMLLKKRSVRLYIQLTASIPKTNWNNENRMKNTFSFFSRRRPSAMRTIFASASFSASFLSGSTEVLGTSCIDWLSINSWYTLTCELTITLSSTMQINVVRTIRIVKTLVYFDSCMRFFYSIDKSLTSCWGLFKSMYQHTDRLSILIIKWRASGDDSFAIFLNNKKRINV